MGYNVRPHSPIAPPHTYVHRGYSQGGTTPAMPSPFAALTKAARNLTAFREEAATGKFPVDYVVKEESRLTRAVQVADEVVSAEHRADYEKNLNLAQDLRAKAEASVDPTTRLADLTEHRALVEGPLSGDALLADARVMLQANQPARARLFLSAAVSKGVREPGLHATMRDVEDALDKDGPRFDARTIETAAAVADMAFSASRFEALAKSGVGISPDGTAGHGHRNEATSANLAAKVADYYAGVRAFKVGDGSATDGAS